MECIAYDEYKGGNVLKFISMDLRDSSSASVKVLESKQKMESLTWNRFNKPPDNLGGVAIFFPALPTCEPWSKTNLGDVASDGQQTFSLADYCRLL